MHTLHSDQLVTMAAIKSADVMAAELNDILRKWGGGGGGGGGVSNDQFEQLRAVIAKNGERKVAELDKFAKAQALRNVALGTQHDADAREKKKVLEKNAELGMTITKKDADIAKLLQEIDRLKQGHDHGRTLQSWKSALLKDAAMAGKAILDHNIEAGEKKYTTIVGTLATAENDVHTTSQTVKNSAGIAIATSVGAIAALKAKAEKSVTDLNHYVQENTAKINAATQAIKDSEREMEVVKAVPVRNANPNAKAIIQKCKMNIRKQRQILAKCERQTHGALVTEVQERKTELENKEGRLTKLEATLSKLAPAAPEAPKAPAPDSDSFWTRSRLVGAAGLAGAAVVGAAANYGPSMPSLWGGNSGTAGGGGANGTKVKPRGSKANGNDNNNKGDHGRWPEPKL